MRPTKPDIWIALDFGGSLTKIIYQGRSDSPQLLVMAPEVISTTRMSLDLLNPYAILNPSPEAEAWVGVAGEIFAVGNLAQQLHGSAGLRSLKWEKALYKTLAALWVIQRRLGLRSRFKVALSCVLPPGEYENRSLFEAQLQDACTQFETPDGPLRITLQHFTCLPECAGVASQFSQHYRMPEVCAFIMLGYRNASLLLTRQGHFVAGKTSELGFVRCIEWILAQTSGLKPDTLLPAIAQARHTGNAVPYLTILPYADPDIQKEQARRLVDGVEQAKQAYVQMLTDWLSDELPLQERPTLSFYGGTTNEIQTALEHYQPHLPHHYHAGLSIPEDLDTAQLGDRLADVYAVFQILCQSVRSPSSQVA